MSVGAKIAALNSFAGFSIEDPKMLFPPRDDGVNLVANATLPNPSVMTIEIVYTHPVGLLNSG